MDDLQKEFIEIVSEVRSHLEYQKALGIRAIEIFPSKINVSRNVPIAVTNPPVSPLSPSPPLRAGAGGPKEIPLAKGGEEGFASPEQAEALDVVCRELGDCTRCKLHKGRKSIVFGEGNPRAVLVFVGEGPGFEEDRQGRPFVGEAGQLLTDIIVKGMKIKREEVYICNVVKCRPPDNRTPEPDEITACVAFLRKQLQAIKPSVIVTLGNVPTQTLLGTKEGITRLRGTWRSYEGIPLMPTFHPAYLLRNPKDKKLVWDDIRLVMAKMKKG